MKKPKKSSIGVPQSFLNRFAETYSADTIAIENRKQVSKIRRTLVYDGADIVCVGYTSQSGKILNATGYHLVAKDSYAGKITSYLDSTHVAGYEGVFVHFRSKEFVLTQKIEFEFEEGSKPPIEPMDPRKLGSLFPESLF